MRLFHAWDTMDWGRVFLIGTAAAAFWGSFQAVVPERYWKWGMAICVGTIAAASSMMRSGKSRGEKIDEKIEAHHADAEKKSEEIQNLVVSELKERAENK